MGSHQSPLGDLLIDFAKTVRGLSDHDFRKFIEGELRLTFSVDKRQPSVGSYPTRRSVPPGELQRIQGLLNSSTSREEAYAILREHVPLKDGLFALARLLDLPVQRKDKVDKIREKIVASTVGRRLSGEAIRGGYSADGRESENDTADRAIEK